MLRRKILLLSIFLVSLLAISAVSAADNATDDIVCVSDDNNAVSVDNNDNALNSDESDVLRADESNKYEILKSDANNTVEVLSASNVSQSKSCEVLGAVNPESSAAEPVLKSSNLIVVKMKIKYDKVVTKKIGKYKIKAHLYKVPSANGYMSFIDIRLFTHGKQVKYSKYLSKYQYKENGKWKWWPKWRHGGTNQPYHRYINCVPIKAFKVKFRY